MSGRTRVNPNRKPSTEADVKRAERRGMERGLDNALTLMLWVLADKHDATPEEINKFGDKLMELADSVQRGYVRFDEIRAALKDEYDWEFVSEVKW